MKKIIIEIEEDVIKALNEYLAIKKMTGNIGGIADSFINKFLLKIRYNIHLKFFLLI